MRQILAVLLAIPMATACCGGQPRPASFPPSADAALERMHATYACGNAMKAFDAKFDQFAEHKRVRGTMAFFVARPARIKMDVFAPPPVSSAVATLTSDGERFALMDLQAKRFLVGPASPCNLQRLTRVPVPSHVLVELLEGQAPVLKHDKSAATIDWNGKGYYVLVVPGAHEAQEEIHMAPRPEDLGKPWAEQRMRVLDVAVRQQGFLLYHAELDEHSVPPMDTPIAPVIPGDPFEPLSGPTCDAEVPHKIFVEIPIQDQEVRFRYERLFWNPPLPEGTFTQPPPQGMVAERVTCE